LVFIKSYVETCTITNFYSTWYICTDFLNGVIKVFDKIAVKRLQH